MQDSVKNFGDGTPPLVTIKMLYLSLSKYNEMKFETDASRYTEEDLKYRNITKTR